MFGCDRHQLYVLYTCAGVVAISLLVNYMDAASQENCINNRNAVYLLRKSKQWNVLCDQDQQRSVAFQHINYAIAYLNAARDCASDALLEQVTKTDLHTYTKMVHQKQNMLQKRLQGLSASTSAPKRNSIT